MNIWRTTVGSRVGITRPGRVSRASRAEPSRRVRDLAESTQRGRCWSRHGIDPVAQAQLRG